jgi:hypothetical protein
MAKNKTTQTESSVADFISMVEDETKRSDSFNLAKLMESLAGYPAKMWGPGIIGFVSYHYKYASGHEGDAPLIAFSPRKPAIVLYLATNFPEREGLLKKLGRHKTGKGCIYLKKLADINTDVLNEMILASLEHSKAGRNAFTGETLS